MPNDAERKTPYRSTSLVITLRVQQRIVPFLCEQKIASYNHDIEGEWDILYMVHSRYSRGTENIFGINSIILIG